MSGYIVRRAFPEDKDDILRLHDDVYNGLDYLPDYFDDFMRDPLIRSYVYEEFGEIVQALIRRRAERVASDQSLLLPLLVSFPDDIIYADCFDKDEIGYLASHIVDGGVTAIDRAGRVNPRHIGTGVYRRLLSGVEQLNKEEGLVQRHALVKIEPPSANFRNIYRHIMTRNIHSFEFEGSGEALEEQLENRENERSILKPLHILGDTLPSIYFKSSALGYLFPEKRLLIDWVPFRPIEANIPIMKGKNTLFASDVSLASGGVHNGLLSASSIYRPHHGVNISCTIDLFGSDCRSLGRHMAFHLKRIQSCGHQSVNLAVITNNKQDSAVIDKNLRKFGIERSRESGPRSNPEVYEKYL